MTAPGLPPEGPPVAIEWGGIVEGRVASSPAAVQAAAEAMSACGGGDFACEIQGGRFSLIPRTTTTAGKDFHDEPQARFLAALGQLVAQAQPGSVESTLRSRMFYGDRVAETLFAVRAASIAPMTRVRPRQAGDGGGTADATAAGNQAVGRRELLLLAPLVLGVGGFLAWRSNLLDRALAARADKLALDAGPFAAMLALSVEPAWGGYDLKVTRGPAYPKDPAELGALREAAASLVARAACDAVGDGGKAWAQVLDATGAVRSAAGFELRDLLARADGAVVVRLAGAISAATIRLSLTADVDGPR
jgi:hypothetical protein